MSYEKTDSFPYVSLKIIFRFQRSLPAPADYTMNINKTEYAYIFILDVLYKGVVLLFHLGQ